MNGKEIKEKLQAESINLSELSKRMGYKTDQNLHSVLGAADVKSSVIERIARAIGKPISWFYGDGDNTAANKTASLADGPSVPENLSDMIAKKDEQIDRLLTILEKMSDSIPTQIGCKPEEKPGNA